MKKIYEKSELLFFFLLFITYLFLQSAGHLLSAKIGIAFSAEAALNLSFAVFLYMWIRSQGLLGCCGLCRAKVPASRMLWYVPLLILSTGNLWSGFSLSYGLQEALFYGVSMACAAFLEELLIRCFLLRYLQKESTALAVFGSSAFFGFVHLLNLLQGAALSDTLLQIAGALCVGFLYAAVLLRSGSLWPGILSHGTINVLFLFSGKQNPILLGIQMALMLLYGIFLLSSHRK